MTKREFLIVEQIIEAAWAKDVTLIKILLFRLELAIEAAKKKE